MEIKKRSHLHKEREAKRLVRRTTKRKTYQYGYRQRKTQSGLVRYELEGATRSRRKALFSTLSENPPCHWVSLGF